ncbi:MAG: autotransporter assembly complex protein TamA [Proteobacteria bacterium]|nr:autotransporter assembly complex protein TamA [Pseudomonadota bacterium]
MKDICRTGIDRTRDECSLRGGCTAPFMITGGVFISCFQGKKTSGRERILFLRLIFSFILYLCITTVLYAAGEQLQVAVEGLDGVERTNVEAALVIPSGLVKEGSVDRRWLERFKKEIPQKVHNSLEPFGYYKTEVSTTIDRTDEGKYRLQVNVKKGDPLRISAVSVSADGPGAGEKALADLISKFPLRKGDVLRQDIYERAKAELQNRMVDLGYLDVSFSVHKISVLLNSLEAQIDIVLQTGSQYRFGDVTFSGNISYPEIFLSRYLQFKGGEVFSYEKLANTQANLTNSDRFREIVINAKKEKAVDYQVPIEIVLVPSLPKRFKIGIGYGTDTGPRGSLYYQDVNIARRGHELLAEMTVSPTLQGIATRYTIPGQKDANTLTSFKIAAQAEDTQSYTINLATTEVERARSFGIGRIGSLFMQMQKEHSEAGNERTNSFLIMPGLRFSERRFDKLLRPYRGYHYQTELKGTTKELGSDVAFMQYTLKGEIIIPLPYRFSILTRMQAGATWQADAARDLPITLRFFAGGDNNIRGYKYQSLGPKGDNGEVTGGRNILVGNIELERAISNNWGIAAFYDVGNAFNNFSNIDPAQGTGIGCRYYTPVGPIRFDLARQIGIASPGYRIHFSIGMEL